MYEGGSIANINANGTMYLHTRAGTVYTRIIVHVWRG